MSKDLDLMIDLRAADPLLHRGADASPARMARIHRIVDARLGSPTSATPGREAVSGRRGRRILALAGAATALAVLGTTGLSLLAPDSGPSLAVTSVALAKDGSLRCNPADGFAGAIDPADSPVRLLPTWLPTGWQVGHVWAVKETDSTCYRHPSLTLADTDRDGRVLRSAMVYGPIAEPIEIDGDTAEIVEATIAGQPGRMIDRGANAKGPDELLWVWTDSSGAYWLMRSYGFAPKSGRVLAGALRLEGTTMGLDLAAAPQGTTVVHQRTGEPYPARTADYRWTATLGTGPMQGREGEVVLEATSSQVGTLGDGVFPDQDVAGSGRTLQVRQYAYGGMNLYQRPGLAIRFGPNEITGGEPSLGSMAPGQWERVVESLEQVSADDPRLADLALDE